MDFLALCQKAALESGVIAGTQPTTVVNQTGLLAKIVSWTADAVEWVEQEETGWRWMQKPWTGPLTANNRTYTAASFAATNADFGAWIIDDVARRYYPTSVYLTATGVSDEQPIRFMPYDQWQRTFDRGTQTTDRPSRYTISPQDEIIFAAEPNDAFTARGMYRRRSLRPTVNTSTPEWAPQFHMAAVWESGRRLALYDEAYQNAARCERERDMVMAKLRQTQLPVMRIVGRPLA